MSKTTQSLSIWLLALCLFPSGVALASPTGTVTGSVKVKKAVGGEVDPSGVVVYLGSVPGAIPPDGERAHTPLYQRELQFTPPLLVVVQGTTVDFLNDDKVFHNVFSFSEAARFDLGLYKSGTSKSVTFRRPGVVNVYCNIHPEMISKIKVLDTTFYAVVGKDGSFHIDHVPPGSYPVVAWQSFGDEFHGQVTVTAGAKSAVTIDLTQGQPELRHTRKDGTPYGRYK